MPGSPLTRTSWPAPVRGPGQAAESVACACSRPTRRGPEPMGVMIAAQGRSSKTRFIGAGTSRRRTDAKPARSASSRSSPSPAWAPSGSRRGGGPL